MRIFAALLTFVFVLSPLAADTAQQGLIHRERSLYRDIFVIQDGDERCMLFRFFNHESLQSCKYMSIPDKVAFYYTQMMLSGLYLDPAPKRILIIGLGGGTLSMVLQQMLPNTKIDVVELDDAVNRIAATYFDFKPGKNTSVIIQDGRVYVKRIAAQKPSYDMVLLDAFNVDYIPEHMMTREFLQEVKAIMAPNGVIVANTFSNSALYDYESVTYAAVFGVFFNLKKIGNRIIVGRLGGLPQMEAIRANAKSWEAAFSKHGTSLDFLLPMLTTKQDWNQNARVLTDQYSPSNLLNAIARDRQSN